MTLFEGHHTTLHESTFPNPSFHYTGSKMCAKAELKCEEIRELIHANIRNPFPFRQLSMEGHVKKINK